MATRQLFCFAMLILVCLVNSGTRRSGLFVKYFLQGFTSLLLFEDAVMAKNQGKQWTESNGLAGKLVAASEVTRTITLKSDASTLAVSIGLPGVPSNEVSSRLDTAKKTGLIFKPVAVGPFGTFTPIPPDAPRGTLVLNIPPGDGRSGYFKLTFTMPETFSGTRLNGRANVDDRGRVFLNGNPISPSLFCSTCPNLITQYGNASFSTNEQKLFKPGNNEILISDANLGGGPSGAAFYIIIIFSTPSTRG